MLKIKDKIKAHILFSATLFVPQFRLWEKVEKYGTARQATDDNIILGTRLACWVTKATDTHPEYAILIAFSLQPWLHERASMLRYTYTACLT
jgi:hypothetical protein